MGNRGFMGKAISGQKIEIVIVTSSRTEKAFQSGKDDDVGVFPKKDTAK